MANNSFKIDKSISLNPLASAPSSPQNGDIYYDSGLNKFRKYENSAWSDLGSGGTSTNTNIINFVSNPDAETDTTGWAAYADAAGASPVDGTGGSPTVTITRSTSTPLRGTGSFLITKDVANRQGQGVSYDFSIDTADKSKTVAISFAYDAGTSVTGASSDVRVWIYDVTNNALIAPLVQTISSTTGIFYTNFIATTSTSYRLILHIATTNASAWTFKFDTVNVSPNTNPNPTAKYTSTSGQSISASTTTIVDFGTKTSDSHGAVTTGASWKFTAPVPGVYMVCAIITWAADTFTTNNTIRADLYKNNSLESTIFFDKIQATTSGNSKGMNGSTIVSLIAGDYIDIRVLHQESTSRSLSTTAAFVNVSIAKVG